MYNAIADVVIDLSPTFDVTLCPGFFFENAGLV
jgi:hypothetical protein